MWANRWLLGTKTVKESKPKEILYSNYYPGQKKNHPRGFAARRTLFHMWYHARSGAISAGQKSQTVADRTCPALIAPDRAWYHTWNSVLLAANLQDGSFFVQGSRFTSRIICWWHTQRTTGVTTVVLLQFVRPCFAWWLHLHKTLSSETAVTGFFVCIQLHQSSTFCRERTRLFVYVGDSFVCFHTVFFVMLRFCTWVEQRDN